MVTLLTSSTCFVSHYGDPGCTRFIGTPLHIAPHPTDGYCVFRGLSTLWYPLTIYARLSACVDARSHLRRDRVEGDIPFVHPQCCVSLVAINAANEVPMNRPLVTSLSTVCTGLPSGYRDPQLLHPIVFYFICDSHAA